jgi:hypothetical protein
MTNLLKPFDDGNYLSEEEALKLIEKIPIPVSSGSESIQHDESKQPDVSEAKNPDLENRIIQLDNLSAENGSKKTQDDWVSYWNNINNFGAPIRGRIFASMPDYYQAFKQLKEKVEHGSSKDKQLTKKVVDSLREDFDWPSKNNWLISSTRIKYQSNTEDAQIIHHYNCNNKSLIQQYDILIPEYLGVLISDVVNDTRGLTYLQTFLGTKDNKNLIMENLEFISNKPRNEIKIWTPPLINNTYTTRTQRPERASGFDYGSGEFHVDGSSSLDNVGRSRGVLVNPR